MNYFVFGEKVEARACACLDKELFARLFKGFCFSCGELNITAGEKKKIVIGKEQEVAFDECDEYAIKIAADGVTVVGRDRKTLARGFIDLLTRIEAENLTKKREFRLACGDIHGKFSVGIRMAHLCVFPETDLFTLTQRIRALGALRYTHLIIEFWGMLKFDCMAELSWRGMAFEKDEIAPLIREARGMGMEIVPMFNHLGHAPASRMVSGKHVVLDQNPMLQHLFTPDGWAWDIESVEVRELLKKIRAELYELCGEGEYVHLGCDESFIHSAGYADKGLVGDYIADAVRAAEAEGRRAIIWGDMLLCGEEVGCAGGKYYYECNEKNPADAKLLRSKLPRSVVIADWHYDVLEGPIVTSIFLKNEGFDVIGCPWYNKKNIKAHLDTVKSEGLFGAMLTTWHTLDDHFGSMMHFARGCDMPSPDWAKYAYDRCELATYLRKMMPLPESYEECGFIEEQEIRNVIR